MTKRIFAAIALCGTALAPIASTASLAFTLGTADIEDPTPAGINEADAQAVCDAKAAAHTGNWTGTLDPSSIQGTITSPPVANGDPVIDEGSIQGVGDPVPESIQVTGDPFRIGGSPNMFGFARVVAAHYPDSEHDFTQAFTWQATYTFTCNMTETVEIPATGHHEWDINLPGQPNQNACDAWDEQGLFQGISKNPCVWVEDNPGGPEEQDRPDEYGSIGPVNEGGELNGHENHGGPIPVDPDAIDIPPVKVVICISPANPSGGKKGAPGAWRPQNGYSGGDMIGPNAGCNTTWYNTGATNQPSPYDNLNTGSNNVVTIPPA